MENQTEKIKFVDNEFVVDVVKEYSKALDLLDDYDHQCIRKPEGRETVYKLSTEECRKIIDSLKFSGTTALFGVEKEQGKLSGILSNVYQEAFGGELYPTLEEKAANLLYFLVKDHPFNDGCKRIATTLFLEFLNKNQALVRNGELVISNDTLVALTILIAESRPEEKDLIINLIMNFLCKD